MLRSLNRVFTRILILALLALGALAAFGWFVIVESRGNLYEQKKADIRHIVEAGVSLLGSLEKRVAAGEMTREQAQAEARKLLSGLRYEGNEYIFALDYNHLMTVHPTKPERVGKNLVDEKDPNGKLYIRDFVSVARAGGGHVTYSFQLPQSTEF